MNGLLKAAKDCRDFLQTVNPKTGRHPGHTADERFRAWREAVYGDPDFLYEGNYFTCYESCRGKDAGVLSNDEVRGCITFLLRQMRCEYPPYPCLDSGELLALLDRWITLNDRPDKEENT
ncbi:MAG: hypothetical protein K6A68_08145 [Clostridiales bacterium]|nr:hypothetical protein [Clostridiales bacterium]